MKRIIALLLVLMVILLAGCAAEDESIAGKRPGTDLQKESQNATEATVPPVVNQLHAVNATIDGKSMVEFTEAGSFTATAILAEGQVVDHWVLNDQIQADTGAEFTFTADADTVVVAVVREEKKVTTINAELRFLDANGNPAGDAVTEFLFDEDYVNPVTNETCEGGKISAEIKAVVPAGKIVDYWVINGVPYHYDVGVLSFVVEDLDEATTYEVVLKDRPITYFSVTCDGCSFNGQTSGRVPAGTTITVVSGGNWSCKYYVNGAIYANEAKTITVQINADTYICGYAIIN